MKLGIDGERLCDQEGCDFPAVYYYVWTGPQFACAFHAQKALMFADTMMFPTPASTLRELTPDEMFPKMDEAQ